MDQERLELFNRERNNVFEKLRGLPRWLRPKNDDEFAERALDEGGLRGLYSRLSGESREVIRQNTHDSLTLHWIEPTRPTCVMRVTQTIQERNYFILEGWAQGKTQRQLSEKYDMSQTMIGKIVKRELQKLPRAEKRGLMKERKIALKRSQKEE